MAQTPGRKPDIKPMWRMYSAYLRLLLPPEEESTHFLINRKRMDEEDGRGQGQ